MMFWIIVVYPVLISMFLKVIQLGIKLYVNALEKLGKGVDVYNAFAKSKLYLSSYMCSFLTYGSLEIRMYLFSSINCRFVVGCIYENVLSWDYKLQSFIGL